MVLHSCRSEYGSEVVESPTGLRRLRWHSERHGLRTLGKALPYQRPPPLAMVSAPPGAPALPEILFMNVLAWMSAAHGEGPRFDYDWVALDKSRQRFYCVFNRKTQTLCILERKPTTYEYQQLRDYLNENYCKPLQIRHWGKNTPVKFWDRLHNFVDRLETIGGSSACRLHVVPLAPSEEIRQSRLIHV